MGIPLAALAVRSPRIEGPLDQYTKAVYLKSLLQGQELRQGRIQEMQRTQKAQQRAQEDQQKLQQAYTEAQGDLEKTIPIAIRMGVSRQTIEKIKQSIVQSKKALADLSKVDLDNASQKIDILASAFQSILSLPENQRTQGYAQARGQLIQGGVITAEQAPEQYPGAQFLQMGALSSTSSKDQIAAERQRRVDKETKAYREAQLKKPTARQAEFADFYKAYRESKGLPKNAKVEMQARNAFANLRRAPSTDKPPDPKVKIRAQESKDRAMTNAVKAYSKKIDAIEKDWQPQETGIGTNNYKKEWYNFKANRTISDEEMLELRQEAEDELIAAQEQADLSYLEKLAAAGFEPGQPVDYRAQAEARRAKRVAAPQEPRAVNPQTGEEVVFRGGKWVPVPK